MNKNKVNQILDQTRSIYNRIASEFSNTRSKWYMWGIERMKDYAKPGDKILDIGCGNGRLAEIFGDDVEYLGIDNSSELIQIAKSRFKNKKNTSFQVGDILDIDLAEQKFDVVYCIAVVHHIPGRENHIRVMKNIYNSLKPGGRAIIFTWNLFAIHWLRLYWKYIFNYKEKLLKHKIISFKDAFIPWKLKNNFQPRYIHSFTKGEMKRLLKLSGFEIESLHYDLNGEKVDIWRGRNLVAVVKKK